MPPVCYMIQWLFKKKSKFPIVLSQPVWHGIFEYKQVYKAGQKMFSDFANINMYEQKLK